LEHPAASKRIIEMRKHTPRIAGEVLRLQRSTHPVDLVCYDLSEIVQAEAGEGWHFSFIDIIDPQQTVFGLELLQQIPQKFFIAAEDLGCAPDRKDVGDRGHDSSGRPQV
jgi:hypothetical protein